MCFRRWAHVANGLPRAAAALLTAEKFFSKAAAVPAPATNVCGGGSVASMHLRLAGLCVLPAAGPRAATALLKSVATVHSKAAAACCTAHSHIFEWWCSRLRAAVCVSPAAGRGRRRPCWKGFTKAHSKAADVPAPAPPVCVSGVGSCLQVLGWVGNGLRGGGGGLGKKGSRHQGCRCPRAQLRHPCACVCGGGASLLPLVWC